MREKREAKNLAIVRNSLLAKRPKSKKVLQQWIEAFLNVKIQNRVLTDGHNSPMDYLWYSFNSDFLKKKLPNADCIVWANRGGGKTELSGIITLLDCIFKPNIQIRILSGSGYQAGRMYAYFYDFLQLGFMELVANIIKSPTDKAIFKNGATVEVIKQSETNVRGTHVHKLRCDEVELFRPRVFEAAQYTTMSTLNYTASLECISTMHRRYGLMKKLIKESVKIKRPVFKWNIWDVIERCKGRDCSDCPLDEYCEGKAKKGTGYYKIDDVISQLLRTSQQSFILEMLCGESGKKKSEGFRFKERLY